MDSLSPEDQNRISPTGETPIRRDNVTDQPLSPKDARNVSTNPSPDAAIIGPPRLVAEQTRSLDGGGELSIIPPYGSYAAHEQTISYGGYGNSSGPWDGYPQFLNAADGLQMSPVVYNDNPSLMFHSGYGFNPDMAYGQYSPVATPMPSMMLDGQLYSPQQIPYPHSFYPQSMAPNVPSSVPSELVASENNGDNFLFGPGSGYLVHYGSYGGGNMSGAHGSSPLTSPTVYSQPMGILGPYEHSVQQVSQQRSHDYGLTSNSSIGGYQQRGSYQSSNIGSGSISYAGAHDWMRLGLDKGRRRERDQDSVYTNESLGFDRNRGPRASKIKSKATDHGSFSVNDKGDSSSTGFQLDLHNNPDFVTDYEFAKFFIIKSFSEDNVHKSIKYKVWASTPHGNKKLDAAYHEAKEKEADCPVFLLFSVNASGQFCGIAEMVGPVDFEKNADYWQQDRWNGQFPVKWHIVKDVPNSRFRHILLDNNDNKPVTHSRDSQEVKQGQGIEMLKIFKDHVAHTSILDDFDFYNQRERALKERRARQQPNPSADASISVTDGTMNQISSNFAEKLQLNDGRKPPPAAATDANYSARTDTGVSAAGMESNTSISRTEDSITGSMPNVLNLE
ncbi:YTH domain-containing protein ECT1-like [Euphorbia lathyris]|uniref:YTH domain-containing protein ECT1-like n=1 Tax=Euphorbia lathyris TaxID=212925 RepID=UPI00331365F5